VKGSMESALPVRVLAVSSKTDLPHHEQDYFSDCWVDDDHLLVTFGSLLAFVL